MKIAIIGSGHVGLVTGACFADLGNDVICMDHDAGKIRILNRGDIPFFEPGLEELVKKNASKNRLRFTNDMKEAIQFSEVIFLCVGTPPKENGEADLSAIEHVAKAMADCLTEYRIIVEKSTVPVETGFYLRKIIKQNLKRKIKFEIASNPEFLREGSAVQDFFTPDRIVLGVESAGAKKILQELYEPFKVPLIITDIHSAELIKHASNSFLAMKISFINMVSQICSKVGADVEKVAEGMGADRRIGKAFLKAGVGFGGSCFPKDLAAFIRIAEKMNVSCNLLKEVFEINEFQKINFIRLVRSKLKSVEGKKIAALGLAFKPDTDDMRSAPAIDILNQLQAEGADITAYDPVAMPEAKKHFKGIKFSKNAYDACKGADAALIFTEWREFRDIDLNRLKKMLKHLVIIDGRNLYEPAEMKKNGFKYFSVGR